MKKIVTIVAAALIASAAFAQISFGGFGRAIFAPIAGSGEGDAQAFIGTSWGGEPRVGFTVAGNSENIGFVFDIRGDAGTIAVNDNAYIWAKLGKMFQVKVGQSFDDTLRGNACFGAWDWLRPGIVMGQDLTFTRVCANPTGGAYTPLTGVIVSFFPVEGLYITAGLPTSYVTVKAADVFKYGQYAAGYTIANIAQIKAQWIGYAVGDDVKGVINAAVNLKAVENLTLEVGAFFGTKEKADTAIAAYVAYSGIENLGLNLNAKYTISGDSDVKNTLGIGAAVSYAFGDNMSVVGDVRFQTKDDAQLAFLVGFQKGFSNGNVGIGFQAATNGCIIQNVTQNGKEMTYAVPLTVTYVF